MTCGSRTLLDGDPGELVSTRGFLAPAVENAVASLHVPAGAWILDAGTGVGGAAPPLARAAGSAGTVRAVDTDPAVLPHAAAHAHRHGMSSRINIEQDDFIEVVERAATDPRGGFDTIWAGDAVGPDLFVDPAMAVVALARALRPGGVLALFSHHHDQAVTLPGHARLERLVGAATRRARGDHASACPAHDHYLSWLRSAGLRDCTLATFPRIGLRIDTDPAARTHLERTVWPRMRAAARTHGEQVGMTGSDLDELQALTTPGLHYVLDQPGHYVLHPTTLVTGRCGHTGRR